MTEESARRRIQFSEGVYEYDLDPESGSVVNLELVEPAAEVEGEESESEAASE